MKNELSKKHNIIRAVLAICCLILCISIFAIIYRNFGPKTSQGAKEVTVKVYSANDNISSFYTHTDATTLHEVLDDLDNFTYEGEEGSYGLMITTINGETADYNTDGAYWAFYINDEYCNYGIDEQPVADGDVFSIKYTKE